MPIAQQISNFYAYPSKVVRLAEIEVPSSHLRQPTVQQQNRATTKVNVALSSDGVRLDQQIEGARRGQNLFLFHEEQSKNIDALVSARRTSFYNFFGTAGTPGRAGKQVAKCSSSGAVLGGLVSGGIALACPAIGVAAGTAVLLGGASGAAIGASVGAIEAWREEKAIIRTIDYVLNFNKMHEDFRLGKVTVNTAADMLFEMFELGNELGPGAVLIFDEARKLIRLSPDAGMQSVSARFDRLLSDETLRSKK